MGHKILLRMYPQLADAQRTTVKEIIDYAEQQKKGKLFKRIVDNKDLIDRNVKLMNLDDPMMSTELKIQIVDRLDSAELSLDKRSLTRILMESKITTAFGNYDTWLLTSFQPLTRFTNEGRA